MLFSINALRFLAAAGVMLHHIVGSYTTVSVGAAGVDIFFVISGFVISVTTPDRSPVGPFMMKRFIRVVPLYWIATLAFAMTRTFYAAMPSHPINVVRSMLFLMPFGSDWILEYYPAWTLAYELFFYLAFAIALSATSKHTAAITGAILAAVSVMPIWSPFGRFDTDMIIEFVFGVAVACIWSANIRVPKALGAACVAAAAAAFFINSGLFVDSPADRPLSWGVPSLLLVAGSLAFEDAKLFRNPIIVLGGAASYSIYLTHATVMDAMGMFLAKRGVGAHEHPAIVAVLTIIAALVVGFATHLLVERPLLRALRWIAASQSVKRAAQRIRHAAVATLANAKRPRAA